MGIWKELIAEKRAHGDVLAVVILPQDSPAYASSAQVVGQPRATIEFAVDQYSLWYQDPDTFLSASDMSEEQIAELLKIHRISQDGWRAL